MRACPTACVLLFSSFSPALSGKKREPQTRVGLVTSSLPRKRSTTELLRLMFLTLSFENLSFSTRSAVLCCLRCFGAEDGARTRHL